MAGLGGKRPGAGRKKGVPNKATVARQQEIAESGLTPLEYMINMLRSENEPPERRMWAAQNAAPYVHPKLSAVDTTAKGADGGRVVFEMVVKKTD